MLSHRLTAPVITVLEPSERSAVDVAGMGFYKAIHRDNISDVLDDLKKQRVSAVLVSVVRCGRRPDRKIHAVVREFPSVPTVALLGTEPTTAESLLNLGNAGITRLVDVRSPSGWNRLRHLLGSESVKEIDRKALDAIRHELGSVSTDCWKFFDALLTSSEKISTVRALASRLHVRPNTLMSRFFRANLPAPKKYLVYARLMRAARLLEDPGHSVADVANALDYSSPQGFSRHVRTLLGLTAGEFRANYTAEKVLEKMLAELVRPHKAVLSKLSPLEVRVGRNPPSISDRMPSFHLREEENPD